MVAAIYARKSTDQNGVSEEQRSVTRQVEQARAYAARHEWIVRDDCIFCDDGISGAEFDSRPGFIRLMNTLKPKPPFEVLIMSEESRLGRESIETAYALKQIVQAGVRVFFYLENRERTLDGPVEKIMLSLTTFADELERVKARQRTRDAMTRKARAGHVTGGRVFGYSNVEISGAGGTRSHVELRINEEEAVVVREIFERYLAGEGLTRIAKALNAQAAPSPRSQRGRPNGWCCSSVREVVRRTLYKGVKVYNRTEKRDRWGRKHQHDRPHDEWITVEMPELAIVTAQTWDTAQQQLAEHRAHYGKDGHDAGRPRGEGARYLLTGMLKCGTCGAGMEVRSRPHGRHRVFFYECSAHRRKGDTVCANDLPARMEDANDALLEELRATLLDATVLEAAIVSSVTEITAEVGNDDRREGIVAKLAEIERQQQNVARAIAVTGDIGALADELRALEREGQDLKRQLSGLQRATVKGEIDRTALRQQLRDVIRDWRTTLSKRPSDVQPALRRLIEERIEFIPKEDEQGRYYEFRGIGTIQAVLSGVVGIAHKLASPGGSNTFGIPLLRLFRAA